MDVKLLVPPCLVPPARETDKELYFLSNLDQNVAIIVQTVYSFKSEELGNETVAVVLKDALARVLVDYYPFAGRLTISDVGKLAIDCTGEGVIFVEAEANCELKDIGDISIPDPPILNKFVYMSSDSNNILQIPPLTAQVTKFRCGGFVLGLSMNHCMCDGVSAMDFINSWSEIARNIPLSFPPFLDRTLLKSRVPPVISNEHHEFAEIKDVSAGKATIDEDKDDPILHRFFNFDVERLNELKRKVMDDSTHISCTSFEALSGFIWRSRTDALQLDPVQEVKLLFAVDGRKRLDTVLPKGYFGNGIVLTNSLTTAGDLTSNPLSHAVGLVKKAVKMVDDEYMRSAIDFFEKNRLKPSLTATLLITTWLKLDFYNSDFGWGTPLHTGPVDLPAKEICVFLPQGKERKSIDVLLGLPQSAMRRFQEKIEKIFT
ncbi:Omega-hydroxypalmitate O-feruloyl transferase [Zostera marina]|uniref:Omega-hydroxypalmitate O-feruloyl transferase n=1 Tax=Zostera marina TaxID=29655 RepID=A0A0K9PIQ4_ZOSMR|nr:Omega-hydroxypalmitate O-feruloyl transferase [Zostera marina]